MSLINNFYSKFCLLLTYQLHCSVLAKNSVCNKSPATVSKYLRYDFKSQKNMDDASFKYETRSSSVAFVTTPDENIAKKLAKGLIEQQLAACVNILPSIQSIYMWEGKLNEDQECLMMIKTRSSRVEELTKWVRDNHPYSVAEVITIPIENGNIPYMKWLSDSVPEKK